MDTTQELKVGDRVKYIGTWTPHLKDLTGTIRSTTGPIYTEVAFDNGETGTGLLWESLELIPCTITGANPTTAIVDELGLKHPDTKATNPKDAIGSTKLALNLVPDTMEVFAALAFTEGALKYGGCNWRVAGVRASIYYAALKRHLKKYWNGEWADPKTGVPHLASVMACAAIIMDANHVGKLTDDRPPRADLAGLIDGLEPVVANLREMFKDHTPHHHTALDEVAP